MPKERPSRNPNPAAASLQIWRNPAGVIHVGKNGWEAMIVFEDGKLVALDKLGKRWVHRELSKDEWDRVKAEMAKGKNS